MNIFKRIYRSAMAHKVITGIIIIVVAAGGYYGYKKATNTSGETRYVLAAVQEETLTSSVTGTGQVSASNEIDLKPKASGDITYVGVKAGDKVTKGTVIARLDAEDATKDVRDAELALQDSELALQKLEKPADETDTLQAENSVTEAKESKTTSENNLVKEREDGFDAVADSFLDFSNELSGVDKMINAGTGPLSSNGVKAYGDTAESDRDTAVSSYYSAKSKVDDVQSEYKSLNVNSDPDKIDALISDTYDTARKVSQAVKDAKNLVDYVNDQGTDGEASQDIQSDETSLSTYTNDANSHVSALLSSENSITSSKADLDKANRTIEESQSSLNDLQEGPDSLDVQTAELSLKEKQNALDDANEKLADYSVVAPFDGVIGTVSAKVGDTSSSDGALATILTDQNVAVISLNEVDVAKISVGDKANLTFDALPDLNISGEVAEVDALGTVSQGVVSYDVKITFDTQDDRVKSGMSVSASIITASKTDAITVPSSAVKTDSQGSYVQVFDNVPANSNLEAGITSTTAPQDVSVVTGLSNDTDTEITSGLSVGQYVVTRTTTGAQTTTAATTQTRSLFGGGTTGGAARTTTSRTSGSAAGSVPR